MIGNNTRTWVGGTAVLTVLGLLVAWFLLIAPQRAQAAELRQQTLDLQVSNDRLVSETAELEQQFSHLPELQDELGGLRASVPETLALSELTRQFSATAAATGVTLVSIAPGTPSTVVAVAVAPAPAVDPATGTAATDPAAAGTTTADGTTAVAGAATTVAPGSASGVVATPITLEVVGTPAATTAFVESLQTAPRAFLVTAVSVTAETEADASGGRPATETGDTTLSITGSAFVLPQEPATAAAPAVTATPAP